jgi:ATP-dependent Clp protease protease subunit
MSFELITEKQRRNPFNLVRSKDGDENVLYVYGDIGTDWLSDNGIGAKDFAEAIDPIGDGDLNIRINSGGGNVWDGIAIASLIESRKGKTRITIDGWAGSIATRIAISAPSSITKDGMFMIHDPSIFANITPNRKKLQSTLDLLDGVKDGLISAYMKKTGLPQATLSKMMEDETFMTAQEAVNFGFVDGFTTDAKVKNKASGFSLKYIENRFIMNKKSKVQEPENKSGESNQDVADNETLNETEEQNTTPVASSQAAPVAKKQEAPAQSVAPVVTMETLVEAISAQVMNKLNADRARQPLPPAPTAGLQVVGNSLVDEYSKLQPGFKRAQMRFNREKYEALRNHFGKQQQRDFGPRNVNTFAAALVPDTLSDAVIDILTNKLAMLTNFSSNFGLGFVQKSTVQVAKATVASAAQTDPADFEVGDTTLANVPIAVSQRSKSFTITNLEAQGGHELWKIATINANVFKNAISDVVTALLTVANFGAARVVGASTAFTPGSAALNGLLGDAKDYPQANLVMDGSYLANLAPTNREGWRPGDGGAFNYDSINMQNRFTGAVANCVGFVAGPNAIALAAGLPLQIQGAMFDSTSVTTVEALGLQVAYTTWTNVGKRAQWASYDIMFGAAVGDGGATGSLKLAVSA